MSGGSYDYVSYKIEDAASRLRSSHREQTHVIALAAHLDAIAKVMHDIEWADSGDTSWTPAIDDAIRVVVSPAMELSVATERAELAAKHLNDALARTGATP